MEGPSLYLAAEQLRPLKGARIITVEGNSTIGKDRLVGETVRDVFAWGKHLVLQCGSFALRTHFLLYGTYEADVEGRSVTGDYRRARTPRLLLSFPHAELRLYNCSVRYIEGTNVKRTYDFSIDIMARAWDPAHAFDQLKAHEGEEVADVLLDQAVFAGVGNIIKNEVLALEHVHPRTRVAQLSTAQRKSLIARPREFSLRFLRWRKAFALRKHLRIHQKGHCPVCGGPVTHMKTGKRQRMSHFCPRCQVLPKRRIKGSR